MKESQVVANDNQNRVERERKNRTSDHDIKYVRMK